MAKRVYRTAQGKSVDLGALQLQNETVRAVGNMGVNARGDVVNAQNDAILTRNASIQKQYRKQVRKTNVSEDPVVKKVEEKNNNNSVAEQSVPVEDPIVEDPIVEDPIVEQKQEHEAVAQEQTASTSKLTGLAGAIAKAKEVKQEPMKTPRQLRQEKSGVKKI